MHHREPIISRSVSLLALTFAGLIGCSGEHGGHDHGPAPSSTPIPAITHDALFVVNGGDSSLSVINTETNELAGTIALTDAAFPHHIYLSEDRSKMLVAVPGVDLSGGHSGHAGHSMHGAVLLLDATTGATLRSRLTDAMNHNAAFAPGGLEVWTTQMTTPGSVLVLDEATLDTKQTVLVGDGPSEVTFSADGAHAFVANGMSNSVTVITPNTKAVVKTIPVGKTPVGAWQGWNGVAYVDNETDQTLTAIDTKTLDVLSTTLLGFTPGMAALAPDETVWVTDGDSGRVVIYGADTGAVEGEITTGAGAHAIVFSNDGTSGYVSNQAANTVSVISVAVRQVVKTIPVGDKPNGIVWRAK